MRNILSNGKITNWFSDTIPTDDRPLAQGQCARSYKLQRFGFLRNTSKWLHIIAYYNNIIYYTYCECYCSCVERHAFKLYNMYILCIHMDLLYILRNKLLLSFNRLQNTIVFRYSTVISAAAIKTIAEFLQTAVNLLIFRDVQNMQIE